MEAKSYDIDMYFPTHVLEGAHTALVEACTKTEHNDGWSHNITYTDDLKSALNELLFETFTHDDGSITVSYRPEEDLPEHQDDYLSALAPFVHTNPTSTHPASQGGYIVWKDEDDSYWRDSFANGTHTQQKATLQLVFED